MIKPDTKRIHAHLKDFQRKTVEYAFQRLYTASSTRRFLIADEVGLGKTLVARGIIANVIDHLWEKRDQINIVYICSNADIARQNINRLNVTEHKDFQLASRITLLPLFGRHEYEQHKLNFISFTPGTSFDLKSNTGIARERALLYWLLNHAWNVPGNAPKNVLRCNSGVDSFRWYIENFNHGEAINPAIQDAFATALATEPHYRERFDKLCEQFPRYDSQVTDEAWTERRNFVGELRNLLAKTCLKSLRPDLIILDEFQRFKHLLDEEDETAQLARDLFTYSDENSHARVLLLSATPYKMYTLAHESDIEDHYQDFLRTIRFLKPDITEQQAVEDALNAYRHALLNIATPDASVINSAKIALEHQLRSVMVRTERLAATIDRNGMLVEIPSTATLEQPEVSHYVALQQLAREFELNDTLDYWKSAPYLLNFMDDYKLKSAIQGTHELSAEVKAVLSETRGLLLSRNVISTYGILAAHNPRLREIIRALGESWRLLWIPPSMPYYQPEGAYASPALSTLTKRLIFSCWKVVPKTLSALLSYHAERAMMQAHDPNASNSEEARKRRRPLLVFSQSDNRLTGMPILGMLYPCHTLAREYDPLTHLHQQQARTAKDVISALAVLIQHKIDRLRKDHAHTRTSGPVDEAWYWAAPILLDLADNRQATSAWFKQHNIPQLWAGGAPNDEQSLWDKHVFKAQEIVNQGTSDLGPPPPDLATVLAKLAIAGPGTVSLRSLWRLKPTDTPSTEIRNHAGQLAHAFRHLFNLPEVTSLIRGINSIEPYWQRVVEYCIAGNLQATLDEYIHMLHESMGLLDSTTNRATEEISGAAIRAIALRTAAVPTDIVRINTAVQTDGKVRLRARYAMRFGDEEADDTKEITRADHVRNAFNSPFWPFILATTSVGQEGLDFHTYCHAVIHWNLPSNPVDMEQREGRVHRYKGHAIRKNVVKRHQTQLKPTRHDPWQQLFKLAKSPEQANDLTPYWVYSVEGGARIERHIPTLPLSHDNERYESLKRSLVFYRMVFGQSRQEDLVAHLLTHVPKERVEELTRRFCVDLTPP